MGIPECGLERREEGIYSERGECPKEGRNHGADALSAPEPLYPVLPRRRPVHQEHLSALAEQLPRLHTLIIVGCPVLLAEVLSLQRSFPDLKIHRKPWTANPDSSNASSSCSDNG